MISISPWVSALSNGFNFELPQRGGITALKRYKISGSRVSNCSNRGQMITSGSFSASFLCHFFAILIGLGTYLPQYVALEALPGIWCPLSIV